MSKKIFIAALLVILSLILIAKASFIITMAMKFIIIGVVVATIVLVLRKKFNH